MRTPRRHEAGSSSGPPPITVAVTVLTWFWLSLSNPYTVRAQVIPEIRPAELSVNTLTPPAGPPTVSSSAHAVLINLTTGERLFSQLILAHGLADLTTQTFVYTKRIVSEIGDASNQGTTTGVIDHCYEAGMAVHVNAYNLHKPYGVGPACASAYQPPSMPEVPKENCPVLLDLQQDGFHLSGPDAAVSFDIDADGIPDEIAWTKAGENDAFLCLDRNGNGVIDDGRELFGYSTLLLSGQPATIGYRALADLDKPELGGNSDGKINAADQKFQDLCAWVDANRDGISQASEIRTLNQVGVLALGFHYLETRIRDSFGNLFRYVSSVKMRLPSGSTSFWFTFDVIFGELGGAD